MELTFEYSILIFPITIIIIVWIVLHAKGETHLKVDISKGKLEIKRKELFLKDSIESFPKNYLPEKHIDTIERRLKDTKTDL